MVIQLIILLFSVIIHEVSHGLVAYWQGDPTAKYAGRLTLNPIPHLDPIGSVLVPLLLTLSGAGVVFGWAKPVPYNPYNLRDQKWGSAIVGAAGPAANIVLAVLAGIGIRVLLKMEIPEGLVLYPILSMIVYINILLTVFNLLPIPPLDGSKLLFTVLPISEHTKAVLEQYGFVFVFLFLFMFSGLLQALMAAVLNVFSTVIVGVNILGFL